MKISKFLLPLVAFFIIQNTTAQYRNSATYNRLGLQGAVTYGGIHTKDFETYNRVSYTAGFATRANVYNNFIVMYGVNFYQFVTGVGTRETLGGETSEIDFKDIGVQINIFVGQKIIGEHLGIELGPVLQVNGKWEPDKKYQDYYIGNHSFKASDIKELSPVNLNLALNLSGGFRDVKIWLQYQYGVTNTFRKLNTPELLKKDPTATNLKGHLGMVLAGIVFYL